MKKERGEFSLSPLHLEYPAKGIDGIQKKIIHSQKNYPGTTAPPWLLFGSQGFAISRDTMKLPAQENHPEFDLFRQSSLGRHSQTKCRIRGDGKARSPDSSLSWKRQHCTL